MEIEKTKLKSVSCKGKEAPFDHPKVYLEIDPKLGKIDCPFAIGLYVGCLILSVGGGAATPRGDGGPIQPTAGCGSAG